MSPNPDVDPDHLLQYLRDAYGIEARRIALIPDRTHAEATAYRVDTDDASYFFKLTSHGSPHALALSRYLGDVGVAAVLAPLRRRDGALSSRIGEASAILFPFIEGQNGFRRPLEEHQWVEFGTAVRAIHEANPPQSVLDALRQETYTDRWRRKVRGYLAAAPSWRPADHVARNLIEQVLVGKHNQIDALVRNAEQLAASLRDGRLPAVPCHGDLHAGNVLLDAAGSLFIVDWDDPVLAPKERDLMFIGAGIGAAWNRPEESLASYRGYGPTAVDAEAIAYYRCDRIVEDVALFCDDLLLHTGDNLADRELILRRLLGAFGPNDVVEIALNTFDAL